MGNLVETFLMNETEQITSVTNQQTVVPNIEITANAQTTLTLSGTVYDLDKKLLDGAEVVVYSSLGVVVAVCTTPFNAGTGGFILNFSGELNKTYVAVVSKGGYYSASVTVTFNKETQNADITLLTDMGTLVIYGSVQDTAGNAIAGAEVTYSLNGVEGLTVLSNELGNYMLYGDLVNTENYTVSVNLLGYNQESVPVTFSPGQQYVNIDFILKPVVENYTVINGVVVVSGTTVPVQEAFVGLFLISPGGEQLVATTYTNNLGEYVFTQVAGNSEYIVKAMKVGVKPTN